MQLDALNNELGLREDKLLKPVLLAKVSIEELLHSLVRGSGLLTFLVMLELKLKDLRYSLLQLLKGHEQLRPGFVEYTSVAASARIRSYPWLASGWTEYWALYLGEKPRSRSGLGVHLLWALNGGGL